MTLSSDTIVKRNKDTISTSLDDEKIILNLKTNKYFSINSSGSIIYDQIPNQGITIAELENNLKNHFKELNHRDYKDMHDFIEHLSRAKICFLIY